MSPWAADYSSRGDVSNRRLRDKATWRDNDRQSSQGGRMSSTAPDRSTQPPIVLIHGMWMTPLSWEHWANRYRERGHQLLAPAWPVLDGEPEEIRRHPSPLEGLPIPDVIDHYEKII